MHTDNEILFEDLTQALAAEIHKNAREKGFYENPPTDLERICLMHSELSEAAEGVRHANPPSDHIPQFSLIEEELADTIIRILDYSAFRKLRIAKAILAKHEFNKNRPYLHGKTC